MYMINVGILIMLLKYFKKENKLEIIIFLEMCNIIDFQGDMKYIMVKL